MTQARVNLVAPITSHRLNHGMGKKPQPNILIFIDTNRFLDFYRASGEAGLMSLLEHLDVIGENLILTDQIEAEFLNNRQNVIVEALSNLKAPTVTPIVPAYLSDSKTATAIANSVKDIQRRVETIKERFVRILKSPAKYDPVFRAVLL
jgi:hypothetical protein